MEEKDALSKKIDAVNAHAQEKLSGFSFPWDGKPDPLRKVVDLNGGSVKVDADGYPIGQPRSNNPLNYEPPPRYINGDVIVSQEGAVGNEDEIDFDYDPFDESDERVEEQAREMANWDITGETRTEEQKASAQFLRDVIRESRDVDGNLPEDDLLIEFLKDIGADHVLSEEDSSEK